MRPLLTGLLALNSLQCYVQASWKGKCQNCEGIFNNPVGCQYASDEKECNEWSDEKEAATALQSVPEEPIMHELTPNHCAMTAVYSVAENWGYNTEWNKVDWNEKAAEVEKILSTAKDKHRELHKTHKTTKKFQWALKRKVVLDEGGGGFAAAFVQMMLQTVGLNYGSTEQQQPPTYREGYYTGYRGANEEKNKQLHFIYPQTEQEWKKILNGERKFYNSKGDPKPMIGMIIGINTAPWKKPDMLEIWWDMNDHDVALFKYPKNNHWYYLDSNVRDIMKLPSDKNTPMTNVYDSKTIHNRKSELAKDSMKNGYWVDVSLDLGSDIDDVAKWLDQKMNTRSMTNYEFKGPNKVVKVLADPPKDTGGGVYFRIIVRDDKVSWSDQLKIVKKNKDDIVSDQEFYSLLAAHDYSTSSHVNAYNHYQLFDEDQDDGEEQLGFVMANTEKILIGFMMLDLSMLICFGSFICLAIGAFVGYFIHHKYKANITTFD